MPKRALTFKNTGPYDVGEFCGTCGGRVTDGGIDHKCTLSRYTVTSSRGTWTVEAQSTIAAARLVRRNIEGLGNANLSVRGV